jgi:chromosome segregation ATPase
MTATEDTLNLFSTRVRQMILQYKELKKENAELYSMVDEKDKQVENLKAQIVQAQNDYNSLKMAKMLEITDGDMESAQKRLQKLIRDVNKCITLLSEK